MYEPDTYSTVSLLGADASEHDELYLLPLAARTHMWVMTQTRLSGPCRAIRSFYRGYPYWMDIQMHLCKAYHILWAPA